GDELLIGQTIDTNSAFIAQELNKIGVWVKRRVAVGDLWDDIWQALDDEGKISDIVIITGGLGPTADDITKPLLCKYFGGNLIVNEQVLRHVKYLFEKVFRRPGPILERNLKQAEVPDVCTVLMNERGTAPGMWFEKEEKVFVSLPGVPHEMKGLMKNKLEKELEEQSKKLKPLIRDWLVIDDDMTIQQVVAKILKERKQSVGTAESCTGGYIAHLLTIDPGASNNFKGTVVAYDNKVKEDILNVSAQTINSAGAVSEETVKEMLKGALEKLKSDYAVATSGIMGPDGGTED